MNNKQQSMISTGIPSLFMIFTVLCLVILSLMTLGTSRSDLETSRTSLEQTGLYYEACSQATHWLCLFRSQLEAFPEETWQEGGWQGMVTDALAQSLTGQEEDKVLADFDPESGQVHLLFAYSDRMSLDITARVSGQAPHFFLDSWYGSPSGAWQPDLHQNLLLPGQEPGAA